MTTYLVTQLRFARSELLRGLDGVSNEEGLQRIGQMNSIGWIVGHLANQEHFLWVQSAQEKDLYPDLRGLVGHGQPASIPPLDEMWDVWQKVTKCADEYLETLTEGMMVEFLLYNGKTLRENIGTCLLRNTYHIWFHLGEAHAIRQQLGHQPPDFVGGFGEAVFKQRDLNT